MGQFNFNGNVSALNQQIGDGNTMQIISQSVDIDWEMLLQSFYEIESKISREDMTMFNNFCWLLKRREKRGIKEFLHKNLKEFSIGVLSGMSASALIELIKVIL